MEYQVALTPRARRDLANIWKYIAKDNPDAATRFCHNLAQHAYSLQTFPERGHELHSRSNVWKVPSERYLIFYKILEEARQVEILRFWHAARDRRHLRLQEETSGYSVAITEEKVATVHA